ncbi:MAG: methyltransferase domain-containing protein [Alphaproteobacteria bacterium]
MSDEVLRPFDRAAVRRHRDRAAPRLARHDFLLREVGARLGERIADIRRDFPRVLDLGAHDGFMADQLGAAGGELVAQCDLSPAMTFANARGTARLVADEELLPFAPASFDLAVSNLSLHWVNDLPGALAQVRRALKPDGFFLASLLGGDSLFELRRCLMDAELRVEGGVSPRVSPMADIRDAGNLLTRAGFALPVADSDTITVSYANAFDLMKELRGMGESNAVAERRKTFARRQVLLEAAALYQKEYADDDGRVTVTFQTLYLGGWTPHESQQKPLRPGSAAHRLADALGSTEQPAGDKAEP